MSVYILKSSGGKAEMKKYVRNKINMKKDLIPDSFFFP